MPEMVENRMVVNPEWKWKEDFPEISEKLHRKGYFEMGTGIFVPEEDAYRYAMERISQDEDLKQEFRETVVEWFYSGNWIEED